MEISIAEFLVGKKNTFEISYTFPKLSMNLNGLEYSFSEEPTLCGQLIKKDGRVYGEFSFNICLKDHCSLCLKEVNSQHQCFIEGYIVEEEEPFDSMDEDIIIADKLILNLEHLLDIALLECVPQKILCSEQCKGLCLICGTNLNNESCSCDLSNENIDPRLAKLKELINSNS